MTNLDADASLVAAAASGGLPETVEVAVALAPGITTREPRRCIVSTYAAGMAAMALRIDRDTGKPVAAQGAIVDRAAGTLATMAEWWKGFHAK